MVTSLGNVCLIAPLDYDAMGGVKEHQIDVRAEDGGGRQVRNMFSWYQIDTMSTMACSGILEHALDSTMHVVPRKRSRFSRNSETFA